MSGIIIPNDRTIKQPAMGCCYNPACREKSTDERFEFIVEHSLFSCPKCGANQPPFVHLLVITHLLVPDQKGALIGAGGLRYKMACDETRAYLATVSNQEAASGDLQVVNCPGCLAAQQKENFPVIAGSALYLKE